MNFVPGDKICKIRLLADIRSLFWLHSVLTGENIKTKNIISSRKYYRYSPKYNREIKITKFYKEKIEKHSSEDFEDLYVKNDDFIQINEVEFKNSDKQLYVIELIFLQQYSENFYENQDIVNFQYLLLSLEYLKHTNKKFIVLISGEKKDKLRYTALSYSEFTSRARTFLMIYNWLNPDIMDKIYCYSKYESSANGDWIHFVDNSKRKTVLTINIGKIFPLIPICWDSFKALTDNRYYVDNSWYALLSKYYKDNYYKQIENLFIYQDSLLKLYNQLIKNGSNLERLIFSILVIYYNKEFTEEKLFELHELCMEYVQGIEQILENALFHAVNVNGRITGKALFTIRIRSMSSNPWYKTYIDKELGYDSVNNNAIEIYLTDLQYEKFESITDKFKINIKKRMLLLNNDTEFYNKWEQKINLIQLKHLFGDIDLSKQNDNNVKEVLDYYLHLPQNIAFHYGLQILNNVVSVGKGLLYVSSGDRFSNRQMSRNTESNRWSKGTLYAIYLPLIKVSGENYIDSIAVTNNEIQTSNFWERVEITLDNKELNKLFEMKKILTSENKENVCNAIYEMIQKKINNENSIDKTVIYYIDCEKVGKGEYNWLSSGEKMHIECFAKAIFMCLSKGMKSIALINIRDRYQVLRYFRQFALFYNRNGENNMMKGKSVFLVDTKASIDLLLCDSIKSVRQNMQIGQIFGGVDNSAISIIETICGKNNN